MTIGLFIGRFQPFHKGHLAIIKQALKKVNELKIVIGTAQESRTAKNPLNVAERTEIIRMVLAAENIFNYSLTAVEDIPDDKAYPKYIQQQVGHFDVVYCGENVLVKKLFKDTGYTVVSSKRLKNWIATDIRCRIKRKESYADLIPKTEQKVLAKYEALIGKTMKPVKNAVALVIYNKDRSQLLLVQRPANDELLANMWGLPAGSLSKGETWENAVTRAGQEKLGVKVEIQHLLGEDALERDKYILYMKEFEVRVVKGTPTVPQHVPNVTQYQQWKWGQAKDLQEAAVQGSLCSSIYLRFMKN